MKSPELIARPIAPATLRFTGENSAFRRLVVRGALLELITFGFYRFWLATDMRRHLWSNTEIDGDALEYTGRCKELLLGFLIALAILAPVFLAYFLVGLAFERVKAFASLPLYAFFYLFGQFAVYRARRYRLTRTVWRGVRFWMTGSGSSYAWRSLLWGLLVILTLGFAYPWREAALERYKLGHTFYGNLPARFEATGWQLFKRVWWIWLLGLAGCIAAVFVLLILSRIKLMNGAGLVGLLTIIMVFALPFLHAMRKATEWQWWAEGIRFGDLAVACDLKRDGLIGVYWVLIAMGLVVWLVFTTLGGLATVSMLVALGRTGVAAMMTHPPVWAFVLIAVWYLSMVLTFGVLLRIYTLQRIWQRVANACRLRNAEAATHVMAAGEAASALGEGLADGLDFAGF
ncbi:MAG: DUF898 family protein [Rhodopila sp.]|jgi:uncharacterized membrane protein YjgN (DUF898 family)